MLKIAVIGAGTLLGRELVDTLEPRECSVLPLAHGAMTMDEELGDLVMFSPAPALLEGMDLLIMAETPTDPAFLMGFPGRILDLRAEAEPTLAPMPVAGTWPEGKTAFRGRPAMEQVLAILPKLIDGLGEVSGTHLRSVAHLGDRGIDGLMEQTAAIFKGEDPDIEKLGYRAAFEVVPQVPRGRMIEVKVPAFHGDLLILHVRAAEGRVMTPLTPPDNILWAAHPPSSREVAVSPHLLAHLALCDEGKAGVLTLGFDPILWGTLMPTLRFLGL
jgi:hypothetical protein